MSKKPAPAPAKPVSRPAVPTAGAKAKPSVETHEFPLPMGNYKLMLISFALIALGFILMSGGGPEDLYSFRKITLSVLILMGGFIFMIFAIMKRPKE
jgi:hypothetical protein